MRRGTGKDRIRAVWVVAIALALMALLASCGDDDEGITEPVVEKAGCLGCHGDEAALKETAEPEPLDGDEDPGEG